MTDDRLQELDEKSRHHGRYFLFIGSSIPEAAISRAKASGTYYEQKRLESSAENWDRISEMLRGEHVIACFAKLTGRNFKKMLTTKFRRPAERLIESLGRTKHVVLVHQQALTGERRPDDPEDWSKEPWPGYRERYEPPSKEVREQVLALFEQHEIDFIPYETNAELSVLAAQFVEDHEKHLLLRVYVPAGRLFAEEAGRLLGLFREWLVQSNVRVSQTSYASGNGQVYELVGDADTASLVLSERFDEFQSFLNLCETAPDEALDLVVGLSGGVERAQAEAIVAKYARESKRLKRDLRHERDRRILELRYRLEEELDEDVADSRELEQVLEALVPDAAHVSNALNPASGAPGITVYNQPQFKTQLIQKVEGPVLQSVYGDVTLAPEAAELIALVRHLGGVRARELESAVHELNDDAIPNEDRLRARQKLKGFLISAGSKLGAAAVEVVQAWVESKVIRSE